jgi:hypothetical protein
MAQLQGAESEPRLRGRQPAVDAGDDQKALELPPQRGDFAARLAVNCAARYPARVPR